MTPKRIRLPFRARKMLVLAVRRPAFGPRRLIALLIPLVLIVVWQRDFFQRAATLDDRYVLAEASGQNEERRFVYFLYYLGLYPLVAHEGHVRLMGEPGYKKFSLQAAERVVAERGETLWMESGRTIRAGDMGRALLYLPYAIWTGTARDPRVAPTHAVAFTLALGALYAAFWWVRDPVLGAITVALLGSNPFELYEVHVRENFFGWPITAGIFSLALCLPLVGRRAPGRMAWLLPVSMGLLLGSVRQVRPEPTTILASAVAACLLISRTSWRRRLAYGALVLAAFFVTSRAWGAYFDHKFDEARRVVAAAGGSAYDGPRDRYHTFWHPLWCGLGDFDTTHGYVWNDRVAMRYALPLVQERYRALGRELNDRFLVWDPVYEEVLRAKVLHDISHDPLWYLGILARRVRRVLTWTTPVRLAVASWRVDLPWSGLVTLPLVAALAWTRSWPLFKLALFGLGTSLPALLVFSGTVRGQTYTGWFHVVCAAIVLAAMTDAAAFLLSGRGLMGRRPR